MLALLLLLRVRVWPFSFCLSFYSWMNDCFYLYGPFFVLSFYRYEWWIKMRLSSKERVKGVHDIGSLQSIWHSGGNFLLRSFRLCNIHDTDRVNTNHTIGFLSPGKKWNLYSEFKFAFIVKAIISATKWTSFHSNSLTEGTIKSLTISVTSNAITIQFVNMIYFYWS